MRCSPTETCRWVEGKDPTGQALHPTVELPHKPDNTSREEEIYNYPQNTDPKSFSDSRWGVTNSIIAAHTRPQSHFLLCDSPFPQMISLLGSLFINF